MGINFKAISERLLTEAPMRLAEWFPAGERRGREYVLGSLSGEKGESLSINIDTGIWKDFASGKGGGDLISLYAAANGLKQGEAAKIFSTGKDSIPDDTYLTGPEHTAAMPAHSKYGKPAAVYEYRNADGKICGYVCRFEPPNDKKQIIPRSCWRRENGTIYWKWKKWPTQSPLYNLPALLANPNAPVLVVEGEKAAIRASALPSLRDYIVVTWCGGVEAVKGSDWSHLKDRKVWVWPDADEPGRNAAIAIKKIIQTVFIVNLPPEANDGWDLGDAPDDFDALEYMREETALKVKTQAAQISAQQVTLCLSHIDPKNPDKALNTIQNLRDLLNYYNIIVRYNVISKRVEYVIPNESFSIENGDNGALAVIISYMREWKMSTDNHGLYLERIADENQYNPVLEWVRSAPWDKVSRLPEFYDTVQSPEHEAKELLMRRWMITAMSMALYNGIDAAGSLVLQGGQGLGKTWWVRRLVPPEVAARLVRTDAIVDPKEKDSVSQVIRYWICELGDIGATFRKADVDRLKTFMTSEIDVMRRPYGKGDQEYPRRTALIASVDQAFYLTDDAGNRRFWTVPCTGVDSYHDIDMQQVWAEVLDLIETRGETHRLTDIEKEHITRINKHHRQIEPIHEMMDSKYDFNNEYCPEWNNSTQIAESLGLKVITQRETRLIASYLRKRGIEEKRTKETIFFRIKRKDVFAQTPPIFIP